MMGVFGLFFFMIGYARERKDLDGKKNMCPMLAMDFLACNPIMIDVEERQSMINTRQFMRKQDQKGGGGRGKRNLVAAL